MSEDQSAIKVKRPHRFKKGNKFAVGRRTPGEGRVTQWRRAFVRSTTARQVEKAMEMLHSAVNEGQSWAIKELLDRTLGKADQRLEVTGDGGGPVETNITFKVHFASRALIGAEQPLLESDNGQRTVTDNGDT